MEKKVEPTKPSLEEIEDFKRRLLIPWEHCMNVRQSAKKLCLRLIEEGEFELSLKLAQRAQSHDTSKFSGIEFEYLTNNGADKNQMKMAVQEHQTNNDHHPEYFTEGIKAMNSEQIGELCCDWASRSSEQGTDLRKWIKEEATKKYNFTLQSNVYKKIKYFVDLLLDPPFKKLN
jgi:hypothetical protein